MVLDSSSCQTQATWPMVRDAGYWSSATPGKLHAVLALLWKKIKNRATELYFYGWKPNTSRP